MKNVFNSGSGLSLTCVVRLVNQNQSYHNKQLALNLDMIEVMLKYNCDKKSFAQ